MIIKGLCHKYERWNPVHPTSGAFWGMGIGIGCGVGWGPGFGPEVVGYVGAGCGIGFSVGITFAGIGIGLPTNVILKAPFNVLMAAQRGMLGVVRSSGLLPMGEVTGGGSNNNGLPRISELQRQASARLCSMTNVDSLGKKRVDVESLKNVLSSHTKPVLEGLSTIQRKCFNHHHDTKN